MQRPMNDRRVGSKETELIHGNRAIDAYRLTRQQDAVLVI